jgi:formylglycine-generating enzyme required for sulfatase activity
MGEGDERHRRWVGRSFAIASKEVTVEQFLRFRKEYPFFRDYARSSTCPINSVNWYDAAAYCNWLSEQEGIPRQQWCYLPNGVGSYEAGMTTAANYLQRKGYRLPTEAEWEYSCRAGANGRYSFGESAILLDRFGWTAKNAAGTSQPVGSLKPNDLGLFDLYGNTWEWCQDAHKDYPKDPGRPIYDTEDATAPSDDTGRVLRGGSFVDLAWNVRSATRANISPAKRSNNNGFRPARTFTP